MIRLLISTLVVVAAISQVTPPVWPETFHISFIESYPSVATRANGRFNYDAKRDVMRIDRSNGIHDLICGSVLPNITTPCTQLIRDKKRYVVFPERRMCCMCCDQAHGCGTLKRDWLATAKFEGQEVISGESFNKWSIPDGDQMDYYYQVPNAPRAPRRLISGTQSTADYLTVSYSTTPIADSVFALPDYCTTTCPATTICGKFQTHLTAME